MANKQALRDLQSRLAERLQQARVEQPGQSWLAVRIGGHDMLLPLRQAGEIFDLAGLVRVPHTRPWLLGVVNLRGGVFTVVDLAIFLGVRPAPEAAARERERVRLLAFSASLGVNVALLVDQLLGLRHAQDMQPEPHESHEPPDSDGAPAHRPAFAARRWRDGAGRSWQELNLAELAQVPQFLAVGG